VRQCVGKQRSSGPAVCAGRPPLTQPKNGKSQQGTTSRPETRTKRLVGTTQRLVSLPGLGHRLRDASLEGRTVPAPAAARIPRAKKRAVRWSKQRDREKPVRQFLRERDQA